MVLVLKRMPGWLFVLSSLLVCAGCGGGGGGSDFIGAAYVSISTTPSAIDSGDRTRTRIQISEVHEDGIILKIRFPAGLVYVRDSAFLELPGQQIDIGPARNVEAGNYRYLVFFFSRGQFAPYNYGELIFQLQGISAVSDGRIEVDADVDDPLIDNSVEFDPKNPEFTAEADAYIRVKA